MSSMASILARLERIEKRLALPTGAGNWIRVNGALIWDPWDTDASPDHDPTPPNQLLVTSAARRFDPAMASAAAAEVMADERRDWMERRMRISRRRGQ